MYIYFDRNGYIREIISVPVRQGTSSDDKVYVYFVPSENVIDENGVFLLPVQYNSASVNFRLSDGIIETTTDEEYGTVLEIPYDKTRDLKYFEYFKEYEFVEINIPQSVLSTDGNIEVSITLLGIDATKVLDKFAFLIQGSVVQEMVDITEPMYHRLLRLIYNLNPSPEDLKKFYRHDITISKQVEGQLVQIDFVVYNTTATEYTAISELIDGLPIFSGNWYTLDHFYPIVRIEISGSNTIQVTYFDEIDYFESTDTGFYFNDNIKEI